jgi:SulP family sulfate permease
VTPDYVEAGRVHILQDKVIPPYVTVFRIHGPLLFGVTDKVARIVDRIPTLPPVVVLRLRNMTAIDATGLQALEKLAQALHDSGRTLLLCGAREQPALMMRAAEFHEHIGERNICPSIEAALQRASEIQQAPAA